MRSFLTVSLLLLVACGDSTATCPTGFARIGSVCVEMVDGSMGDVGFGLDAGFEPDSGFSSDAGFELDGADECEPTDEVCDGVDNDCDGEVDEEVKREFFEDQDGDGVGGALVCFGCGAEDCEGEHAWAEVGGDCDDADRDRVPGVSDVCDGVDNDCDGATDEDPPVYFFDMDSDGFAADDAETCAACDVNECPEDPTQWVTAQGDCDDRNFDASPGVGEFACDGVDNDCNGEIDEGLLVEMFEDVDGDGFGFGDAELLCPEADGSAPGGFSLLDGDCAPADGRAFPEAEQFYTEEIEGLVPSELRFDFDCDGEETRGFIRCSACDGARFATLSSGTCNNLPDAENRCGWLAQVRDYATTFAGDGFTCDFTSSTRFEDIPCR